MSEPRPFHRLFALSWEDFFRGTAVQVESEMDLSLKKQLVDVVIIRGIAAPLPRPLPDGFDVLAPHNLVTFKSHQETLDGWALCELIGHYVNYRKQTSPSMQDLLPEDDFQLFAVCARFPRDLFQQVKPTLVREGVYDVWWGTQRIRIVVVPQLPQEDQNAMLLLFSAREELLCYGREHYRPHSTDTSTVLYQLFRRYIKEKTMSQQLQEFVRETIDEILESLPAEERLKGLPAEELRKHLPLDERLKGLSAEEMLRVFRGLDPETREMLWRDFKENGNESKSK